MGCQYYIVQTVKIPVPQVHRTNPAAVPERHLAALSNAHVDVHRAFTGVAAARQGGPWRL